MAAANPFDGNNVLGTPYGNQGLAGFQQIANPANPAEVVNLNTKLQELKDALTQKYADTRNMGEYQNVIVNNLQIIKQRVVKISQLIDLLRQGLDRVRYEIENRMDDTLSNLLEDLNEIQGAQTDAIVAELAEIQTALDMIEVQGRPGNPLEAYGAAGQPLEQAAWNNAAPDAAGIGALPNPPASPPLPNSLVLAGGKKKKGGYTYPKMRSRSRLRSHPRITHKFNTIKPKKKSRRHRKHKKSAKKHRKH